MNYDHDDTLPEQKAENIVLGGPLPDEVRAHEGAKGIRCKYPEDADRTHQKYLMVREPDIRKGVSPAYHEAEPQRAQEGSKKHKGHIDIDQQPRQKSHYHASLTCVKTNVQKRVPIFNPFLSMMQLAGSSRKMQLKGQIKLWALVSTSLMSQTQLMIGETPENAWVGTELMEAARKKSNQLRYRYGSGLISMINYQECCKQYRIVHFSFYYHSSVTGMDPETSTPEQHSQNMTMHITGRHCDEKRFKAAGKLSDNLVNMIQRQIQKSKFQVNQVQKEFRLKQRSGDTENDRKGSNSQWKKSSGEEILSGRDKSEQHERNLHHSHSQRKYFKSEMTPEEVQKIKKLKAAQKKHEQELESKRKLFEENIRKLEEEERELMEKQKKEKNEERVKEVAKKIAQIRAREYERTKKMEEENKRIQDLKRQKTLYEKLDAKFKSVEMEEEKKKEELKVALKKQKFMNFDDIKEHQKKYDDIMRSQKEERERKMGDLTRGNSKKYYQPKIFKDQIDQDQVAKSQHIDKKNQVLERYTNKKEYAQMVRHKIKPNMIVKQDDKDRYKTTTPAPSASFAEQVHMGNQYMKQIHENLQSLKGSSVSKVVDKKEEPFRYKDYLKDIRADRKPSSQKESRYLEQIQNLMKNEHISQQQKFQKAKMLTQKIEDTKKGRNSQKLISSINAKIHLLKHIQNTTAQD